MLRKIVFRLLVTALLATALLGSSLATAQDDAFVIGVSNGFVSSEWRTQMLRNLEDTVALYADAGIDIELVVESANVDVQGQIQQIQNLITRGVDAIIVNPNDQSALNSALEEAVDAGIVVIAVDQEVSAEGVINVVIDQKAWAMVSARWLAEQLGGEGKVVLIEGFVGHPANEARMEGVDEVLAEYPNIEVVGRESGMWDQASAQQVMSDMLAAIPEIDGVWTQDGMAMGVLTALRNAGMEDWPIVTGEVQVRYLQMWNEVMQERPDFTTIGVVNPPGVVSTGLRVAVQILTGGEVDPEQLSGEFGNTLYVPVDEVIDASNFAEQYELYQDAEPSFYPDAHLTQDEVEGYFLEGSPDLPIADLVSEPLRGDMEAEATEAAM